MAEAHNRKRQLVDGKVECPACKVWKHLNEFHRNKKALYGITHKCKECTNTLARQFHKQRYGEGRNEEYCLKQREFSLKRKYGIDLQTYRTMWESQEGLCAICSCGLTETVGPNKAHVDHCHTTEKVRGLLCLRCNQGIGYMREDVTIMQNAIKYVEIHNGGANA